MGEQVPDAHRFGLRFGDRRLERAAAVDRRVGERRDELRHRVLELEAAFLVQDHRRDRRDRLATSSTTGRSCPVSSRCRSRGCASRRSNGGRAARRASRRPASRRGDRRRRSGRSGRRSVAAGPGRSRVRSGRSLWDMVVIVSRALIAAQPGKSCRAETYPAPGTSTASSDVESPAACAMRRSVTTTGRVPGGGTAMNSTRRGTRWGALVTVAAMAIAACSGGGERYVADHDRRGCDATRPPPSRLGRGQHRRSGGRRSRRCVGRRPARAPARARGHRRRRGGDRSRSRSGAALDRRQRSPRSSIGSPDGPSPTPTSSTSTGRSRACSRRSSATRSTRRSRRRRTRRAFPTPWRAVRSKCSASSPTVRSTSPRSSR